MTPENFARWSALRQALHAVPELSGEEHDTAARVVSCLRDYAPTEILTGLGGHGVAALFDSDADGPTVAVRCELDALPIPETSDLPYVSTVPGKGHLCGHDGHMTMVLALAEHLQANPPQRGRVVLIFQPAEETGQGAAAVRADPRFADLAPDYVFALHNLPGLPLGHVALCRQAANCASRGLRIHLEGRTSHAAEPQDGLSPAAAMAELMPALAALGPGGPLDGDFALTTLTHARLGEETFGVAPGAATLMVTLRTVTDARMQRLMAEAEALAQDAARRHGLTLQFSYDDVFEACTNDAAAVALIEQACRAQDIPVTLTDMPQKFSEDFGQFGKSARAAMFWLGSGTDQPQLHNPDYDFPDALIPIGTALFADLVARLTGAPPNQT